MATHSDAMTVKSLNTSAGRRRFVVSPPETELPFFVYSHMAMYKHVMWEKENIDKRPFKCSGSRQFLLTMLCLYLGSIN